MVLHRPVECTRLARTLGQIMIKSTCTRTPSTAFRRLQPMNLPRQYSYNPRLWLIVLTFGGGIAWITAVGLLCACRPHAISLSFGLAPIILGLLLTVRRLAFKRYLLLDTDALVLPTGFLRVRTTRIPYMSIERVWQTRLPFAAVLCVATKEARFDVVSAMLPDVASYIDVGKFLNSQMDRSNI